METLIHLVQSLKPKETQLIKDFYQIGYSKNSQSKKRLLLFEMILSRKVRNDQEAYQALYERHAGSALCQLKKRLQQDILNIILLNPFTHSHNPAIKEEIDCYKTFLMGQVLINRGLQEEGVYLLEKTSSQAQKCELLSIQLSCDDALHSLQTCSHDDYGEKINRSLNDFKELLQAKESYFMAAQTATTSPAEPLSPNDHLKRLKKKRNESHSKKATFWYTMALICHYKHRGKLELAKSSALAFLSEATDHMTMIDEQEKAVFYLQLAQILIGSREPQEAIWPAQQAVRLAHDHRSQVLTALQALFRAYFQTCDWKQAEEVWQRACQEKLRDEEAGVWFFLKSCLLFIKREYKASTQCLLSHEHMIHHKSELMLWAKLLELLNILEVKDFDWFEFKLESFRKRLRRFGYQNRERIRLLFQLFNSLKRNDYNYQATRLYEQTNLALLGDDNITHGRDPLSYELINVYDWFISKSQLP